MKSEAMNLVQWQTPFGTEEACVLDEALRYRFRLPYLQRERESCHEENSNAATVS